VDEVSGPASFEDLKAWKAARLLARSVYDITRDGRLGRDYGLSGQMQRAAVSIAGNIAEGYGRGRPGELHQFRSVASGSLAELRSHCYIALDAGYVDEPIFQQPCDQLDEVSRLIAGLRRWNRKRI
jgi:four helix bundle protein